MKASGWLFFAGLAGALFSKNKTFKFISTTTAVAAGGYSLLDLWIQAEKETLFGKGEKINPDEIILQGINKHDFCPICEEKFYMQCKCAGFIHTLDHVKRGHGKKCKNGHTWYYNKNSDKPIVWPDNLSLQGMKNEPIPEDKYKFRYSKHFLVFDFVSSGPKGNIIKKVIYRNLEPNIYILSMGDYNPLTKKTDFDITTDNKDMIKVLSTIAKTVEIFFKKHPKAILIAEGSTISRNRLYQIQISKSYSFIKNTYIIYGFLDDKIEIYQSDKKYSKFIIRRNI